MPFFIDDPIEIIKDTATSTTSTWSSSKIDSEIAAGGGGGGVIIDDEEPSQTKVYSSSKTQTLINGITDLNFRGPYNGGLSYAVNDVATYLGSSWLRINANGGNVGDTPSEGTFWTLLAGKGDQGEPGLSTSLFEYRIDRNATTLPGLLPGDIRANNADLTLATLLWVSHVDDLGNDVERFIALLQSGSQLIIQDKSTNDNFVAYDVLAGLTQVNNSHIAIPVSYDSGAGLANLVNNHPVFLALQFTTNPSLQIAPTITGAPGTSAEVVNLGTGVQALLQFTIPQGLTGPQGPAGPAGSSTELGYNHALVNYYGTVPTFNLENMATGGFNQIGGSVTILTQDGTTQRSKSYRVRSNVSAVSNGAVSGWVSTNTGPITYIGQGFVYSISFAIEDTVNTSTRTMIGLSNSSTPNTLSSTATVAAVTTQFVGIVQEVGETSFSYYTRGSSSSTKVDSLITCQTPNTGMYTLTIKNAPGSNNVEMTLEYMATGGASASTSISFTAGTTSTISNSNACYVLMQRNLAPGASSAGQLSLIGIRMYYR